MKRILLTLVVALTLLGCDQKPTPNARFHTGEIVEAAIDGQRGQVTRVRCHSGNRMCNYQVRFKSVQGDKWGQAYSEVYMQEFEIKKVR